MAGNIKLPSLEELKKAYQSGAPRGPRLPYGWKPSAPPDVTPEQFDTLRRELPEEFDRLYPGAGLDNPLMAPPKEGAYAPTNNKGIDFSDSTMEELISYADTMGELDDNFINRYMDLTAAQFDLSGNEPTWDNGLSMGDKLYYRYAPGMEAAVITNNPDGAVAIYRNLTTKQLDYALSQEQRTIFDRDPNMVPYYYRGEQAVDVAGNPMAVFYTPPKVAEDVEWSPGQLVYYDDLSNVFTTTPTEFPLYKDPRSGLLSLNRSSNFVPFQVANTGAYSTFKDVVSDPNAQRGLEMAFTFWEADGTALRYPTDLSPFEGLEVSAFNMLDRSSRYANRPEDEFWQAPQGTHPVLYRIKVKDLEQPNKPPHWITMPDGQTIDDLDTDRYVVGRVDGGKPEIEEISTGGYVPTTEEYQAAMRGEQPGRRPKDFDTVPWAVMEVPDRMQLGQTDAIQSVMADDPSVYGEGGLYYNPDGVIRLWPSQGSQPIYIDRNGNLTFNSVDVATGNLLMQARSTDVTGGLLGAASLAATSMNLMGGGDAMSTMFSSLKSAETTRLSRLIVDDTELQYDADFSPGPVYYFQDSAGRMRPLQIDENTGMVIEMLNVTDHIRRDGLHWFRRTYMGNDYGVWDATAGLIGASLAMVPYGAYQVSTLGGSTDSLAVPLTIGILSNPVMMPILFTARAWGGKDLWTLKDDEQGTRRYRDNEREEMIASGQYLPGDFIKQDRADVILKRWQDSRDNFSARLQTMSDPGNEGTPHRLVTPLHFNSMFQLPTDQVIYWSEQMVEADEGYEKFIDEEVAKQEAWLEEARQAYFDGESEKAVDAYYNFYHSQYTTPGNNFWSHSSAYTWKGHIDGEKLQDDFYRAAAQMSAQMNRPLKPREITVLKDFFVDPITELWGEILTSEEWLVLIAGGGLTGIDDLYFAPITQSIQGAFKITGRIGSEIVQGAANIVLDDTSSFLKRGTKFFGSAFMDVKDYFLESSARSQYKHLQGLADEVLSVQRRKYVDAVGLANATPEGFIQHLTKYADDLMLGKSEAAQRTIREMGDVTLSSYHKVGDTKIADTLGLLQMSKLLNVDGVDFADFVKILENSLTKQVNSNLDKLTARHFRSIGGAFDKITGDPKTLSPGVLAGFQKEAAQMVFEKPVSWMADASRNIGLNFLRTKQVTDFIYEGSLAARLLDSAKKAFGDRKGLDVAKALLNASNAATSWARGAFAFSVLTMRPAWVTRNIVDSTFRYLVYGGSLSNLFKRYDKLFAYGNFPSEMVEGLFTFIDDTDVRKQVVSELLSGKHPERAIYPRALWYRTKMLLDSDMPLWKKIVGGVKGVVSFPIGAIGDWNSMVEANLRMRMFSFKMQNNYNRMAKSAVTGLREIGLRYGLDDDTMKVLYGLSEKSGPNSEMFARMINQTFGTGMVSDPKLLYQILIPDNLDDLFQHLDQAARNEVFATVVDAVSKVIDIGGEYAAKGVDPTTAAVDQVVQVFDDLINDITLGRRAFADNAFRATDVVAGAAHRTVYGVHMDIAPKQGVKSFQDFAIEGMGRKPNRTDHRQWFAELVRETNVARKNARPLSDDALKLLELRTSYLEYLQKNDLTAELLDSDVSSFLIKDLNRTVYEASAEAMDKASEELIAKATDGDQVLFSAQTRMAGVVSFVPDDSLGNEMVSSVTEQGSIVIKYNPANIDSSGDVMRMRIGRSLLHANAEAMSISFNRMGLFSGTADQLDEIFVRLMKGTTSEGFEGLTDETLTAIHWYLDDKAVREVLEPFFGKYALPELTEAQASPTIRKILDTIGDELDEVVGDSGLLKVREFMSFRTLDNMRYYESTRAQISSLYRAWLASPTPELQSAAVLLTSTADLVDQMNVRLREYFKFAYPGPMVKIGAARTAAWEMYNELLGSLYEATARVINEEHETLMRLVQEHGQDVIKQYKPPNLGDILARMNFQLEFDGRGRAVKIFMETPPNQPFKMFSLGSGVGVHDQLVKAFFGEEGLDPRLTMSEVFSTIDNSMDWTTLRASRGLGARERLINQLASINTSIPLAEAEDKFWGEIAERVGPDQAEALRVLHSPQINLWTKMKPEGFPIEDYFDKLTLIDNTSGNVVLPLRVVDDVAPLSGVKMTDEIIPEVPGVRVPILETKIDHGPPGYVPSRNSITRTDRNALVSVELLSDSGRVDLVRSRANSTRSQEYIDDLLDSVRREGIKEPITVGVEADGSITIIDGTHRLLAARELGMSSIPAEVRYFALSDVDHLLPYENLAAPGARMVDTGFFHKNFTISEVARPDFELKGTYAGSSSKLHDVRDYVITIHSGTDAAIAGAPTSAFDKPIFAYVRAGIDTTVDGDEVFVIFDFGLDDAAMAALVESGNDMDVDFMYRQLLSYTFTKQVDEAAQYGTRKVVLPSSEMFFMTKGYSPFRLVKDGVPIEINGKALTGNLDYSDYLRTYDMTDQELYKWLARKLHVKATVLDELGDVDMMIDALEQGEAVFDRATNSFLDYLESRGIAVATEEVFLNPGTTASTVRALSLTVEGELRDFLLKNTPLYQTAPASARTRALTVVSDIDVFGGPVFSEMNSFHRMGDVDSIEAFRKAFQENKHIVERELTRSNPELLAAIQPALDSPAYWDRVFTSKRGVEAAILNWDEFSRAIDDYFLMYADPLVATHAINPFQFIQAFEAGGLAVPSIGIYKPSTFTPWGEVDIVFKKGALDPQDLRNKIYGADAYTATFQMRGFQTTDSSVTGAEMADYIRNLRFKTSILGSSKDAKIWEANILNDPEFMAFLDALEGVEYIPEPWRLMWAIGHVMDNRVGPHDAWYRANADRVFRNAYSMRASEVSQQVFGRTFDSGGFFDEWSIRLGAYNGPRVNSDLFLAIPRSDFPERSVGLEGFVRQLSNRGRGAERFGIIDTYDLSGVLSWGDPGLGYLRGLQSLRFFSVDEMKEFSSTLVKLDSERFEASADAWLMLEGAWDSANAVLSDGKGFIEANHNRAMMAFLYEIGLYRDEKGYAFLMTEADTAEVMRRVKQRGFILGSQTSPGAFTELSSSSREYRDLVTRITRVSNVMDASDTRYFEAKPDRIVGFNEIDSIIMSSAAYNAAPMKQFMLDHPDIASLVHVYDTWYQSGDVGYKQMNDIKKQLIDANPNVLFQKQTIGSMMDQNDMSGLVKASIQRGQQEHEIIMNLMQTADVSSVSHEMNHLFVYRLEDLAKFGVNDAQKLLDDLLASLGLESWNEEAYEALAVGWEQFLREGGALSPGYTKYFRLMKGWMDEIYMNTPAFKMSPEIRQMFADWYGEVQPDSNFKMTPEDLVKRINEDPQAYGFAEKVIRDPETKQYLGDHDAISQKIHSLMFEENQVRYKAAADTMNVRAFAKQDALMGTRLMMNAELLLDDITRAIAYEQPKTTQELLAVLEQSYSASVWKKIRPELEAYTPEQMVEVLQAIVLAKDDALGADLSDLSRAFRTSAWSIEWEGITRGGRFIQPPDPEYYKSMGAADDIIFAVQDTWKNTIGWNPLDESYARMRKIRTQQTELWKTFASDPWAGQLSLSTMFGKHANTPETLISYLQGWKKGADITDNEIDAINTLIWEIENYRTISNRLARGMEWSVHPTLVEASRPLAPMWSQMNDDWKSWFFGMIKEQSDAHQTVDALQGWRDHVAESIRKNLSSNDTGARMTADQYKNFVGAAAEVNDQKRIMWELSQNGFHRDFKRTAEELIGHTLSDDLNYKIVRGKKVRLTETDRAVIEYAQEYHGRAAKFLDSIGHTGDVLGALPQTQKEMIDYTHASNFDEFMKNFVPFWSFPSRSIPQWFQFMGDHPTLIAFYNRYMNYSRRMAFQEGATDRNGNQLPSLVGYIPVPGTDYWYNPMAPLSVFTILGALTGYDDPSLDDSGPAAKVLHFLGTRANQFGIGFAPWITIPMYYIRKGLGAEEVYYPDWFGQKRLVPPWLWRSAEENINKLFMNNLNPNWDPKRNLFNVDVPWHDYLVEQELLSMAWSEMQLAATDSEKADIAYKYRQAIQDAYSGHDETLWLEAQRRVDEVRWDKDVYGYFSGNYYKSFTMERAEISYLRYELNLLKQSINNAATRDVFEIDGTPEEIYRRYVEAAYEDPEGFLANFMQAMGWVTYPNNHEQRGDLVKDPEMRRKILIQTIQDDLIEKAYWQNRDILDAEYQIALDKVAIGDRDALYRVYEDFSQRRSELESNHLFQGMSRIWFPGNKPDEMITNHYEYKWFRYLEEFRPTWDPSQDYGEYLSKYDAWLLTLPDLALVARDDFLRVLAADSGYIGPLDESQDGYAGFQAWLEEYYQQPISVTGGRQMNLTDLLSELVVKSTPENYNLWRGSQVSLLSAMNDAFKELYYDTYWTEVASVSGAEARELAHIEWSKRMPDFDIPSERQAFALLVAGYVEEKFPGRWASEEIIAQIMERDIMSHEERLAINRPESYTMVNDMWNLLLYMPPNGNAGFREFIERSGGREVWLDFFYGGYLESEEADDQEILSNLLNLTQDYVTTMGYNKPTPAQLKERQELKGLQSDFYEYIERALGENVMDVMSDYWDLSYKEQAEYRKVSPIPTQYTEIRQMWAQSHPEWAKYYYNSYYEKMMEDRSTVKIPQAVQEIKIPSAIIPELSSQTLLAIKNLLTKNVSLTTWAEAEVKGLAGVSRISSDPEMRKFLEDIAAYNRTLKP